MSEQEMSFQEKSHTDSSIPFDHAEDERHNTNYPFEKLNPQTHQHRHSLNKRLALALSSIGLLLMIFFLLDIIASVMITKYNEYAGNIILVFYSFILLLIIVTITINILYNRKR